MTPERIAEEYEGEEMKPTPRPYTAHILDRHKSSIGAYVQQCVEASGGNDFYFISASHEDGGSVDVAHIGNGPRGKANAAFIVRACNSHEALLEALKSCKAYVDCDSPRSEVKNIERIIDEAIRLAEGRG